MNKLYVTGNRQLVPSSEAPIRTKDDNHDQEKKMDIACFRPRRDTAGCFCCAVGCIGSKCKGVLQNWADGQAEMLSNFPELV
jgi:hypothetical protein